MEQCYTDDQVQNVQKKLNIMTHWVNNHEQVK